MALSHAVLAALLDGQYSGYQLAKIFDVGVSNFWYAAPQQLYAELARLEEDGLIRGRQVIQHRRPNKRVFTVTEAGIGELRRFAAATARPLLIRDDLAVKVQAIDHLDPAPVIAQLEDARPRPRPSSHCSRRHCGACAETSTRSLFCGTANGSAPT